ncbi:holo-ACP synthase [Ferrimonas marina]|uniref:Holo-[acyl-carrier-protein] synthase n=1 Tax=Ferrimonas marina TaxID=299255 RepID=A0A1M5ZGI8_9GAMM|nr:holo-ACP synthase [Ferrimonas marina]SHI23330.1 holo-[acyl-carrier protein] synthase [Ferrimonas marina]
MAIIGLGTDIVAIERIVTRCEGMAADKRQRFAERILTPEELREWQQHREPARLLAKRFAVKEATAKALGTGIGRGVSFQHIALVHNDWGAPQLRLSGGAQARFEALGGREHHVSLSDEQAYVVATVILER